jgi:hypothetical protein
MSIKKEIKELELTLKTILSKKIFFHEKYKLFDFKRKEQEYYQKEIVSGIKKIKDSLGALPNYGKETLFTEKIKNLFSSIGVLKDINRIDEKTLESAVISLNKMSELLEIVPEARDKQDMDRIDRKEFLELPKLPKEIYEEVKASFDELVTCFNNRCYRSSLILCGKILEIAMHRKYFESTGKDLLEKSPDIGLGNLLAKMREKEILFDPGLPQQIHLINQLRVYSVHKKAEIFQPSKEQSQATILYTLDILKKLFKTPEKVSRPE